VAKKQSNETLDFLYKPQSPAQQEAEELWKQSRILFFIGPAGTGKTSAAIGMAINEGLHSKNRDSTQRTRLWLARPAVTCDDEELGFIPGDLNEKMLPWIAPFMDCFGDLSNSSWETLSKTLDVETISVGLLRGRTIRNGTLIVDEGQNLTKSQLVCILTRLGRNSRIVICGDPSQSDLYSFKESPLTDAARKLNKLDTVSTVLFKKTDQLRDPLVSQIIDLL
jgi:phosphate starvation-inducible protein PhoH and related proteins